MPSYGSRNTDEKPAWPVPETIDGIREFFEESEYDLIAVHQDVPGKDLITVDHGERMTVTWEGGSAFGYVRDGDEGSLDEDDDLYEIATDFMDIYESGVRLDDDLRSRFAMLSHSNSPEYSRAINEPMEWGVENDTRHWNEAKKGPIEKIKDLLGS